MDDARVVMRYLNAIAVILCATLIFLPPAMAEPALRYGLGQPASEQQIASWDIAIGPHGNELPQGEGGVAEGATIYASKCAHCHGASGREGPDPVLVGGIGSLASEKPLLTIGSYWPYATTVYDYIARAMPFTAPGSLRADEVYALSAWLLHANGIIDRQERMNRATLPQVKMPNAGGFIADPRPEALVIE